MPVYSQGRVGARYPRSACGPTSLKMVLAYYGIRKDVNYLAFARVGGASPVCHGRSGAGHQAMLDMLRHCGLRGSYMTHNRSLAWLKRVTDAGYPVVVSVRGYYGPRTTRGHILVVVGVTPDGRVIFNDSARGKRYAVPGVLQGLEPQLQDGHSMQTMTARWRRIERKGTR